MKITWVLVFCAALLLASTQADARTHRRHRPRETKIFAAKPWSVSLENEVANEMGAYRFFTQAQVDAAVQEGVLVRLLLDQYFTGKLPVVDLLFKSELLKKSKESQK